jgi:hypothetical protein
MAAKRKPKSVKYQCAMTGKVFSSEEEALAGCEGPYQVYQEGYDRYPTKGFFGLITWTKKKK